MFSKKGEESMDLATITTWTLVIAFFGILVPMFAILAQLDENMMIEKHALTRSLAPLTDAIISCPDRILYNYTNETYWFTIEFIENKVLLYDETGDTSAAKYSYPFTEDKSLPLTHAKFAPVRKDGKTLAPVHPAFLKSGNKVLIDSGAVTLENGPEDRDRDFDLGSFKILYKVVEDIDEDVIDEINSEADVSSNLVAVIAKRGDGEGVKLSLYGKPQYIYERQMFAHLIISRIKALWGGVEAASYIESDDVLDTTDMTLVLSIDSTFFDDRDAMKKIRALVMEGIEQND